MEDICHIRGVRFLARGQPHNVFIFQPLFLISPDTSLGYILLFHISELVNIYTVTNSSEV